MRISDAYVVESLLQSTVASPDPLRWSTTENGSFQAPSFTAWVGPVRIELCDVHRITGTRLCLTLAMGEDQVIVEEPEPTGWWGKKYRCEEDHRIATTIRRLREVAIRQCRERESRAGRETELIRERVFGQLLFGNPGLSRES